MKKYIAIKDDLLSDKIDYKTAFEKIKSLPKPWKTDHWKVLRNEHLKEQCENCGSDEKPLVIQHYKQPEKFRNVRYKVSSEYVEKFKTSFSDLVTEEHIQGYLDQHSEKRIICPICDNVSIRKRKKTKDMVCSKNHVFKKGKLTTYYTSSRTIDFNKARNSAFNELKYNWVSYCFEVHDLEIGKKALLKTIEQGIDYRNFKYTKTYCKRCAAIEDGIVPDYSLCIRCNSAYHHPKYDMCYKCFSIDNA